VTTAAPVNAPSSIDADAPGGIASLVRRRTTGRSGSNVGTPTCTKTDTGDWVRGLGLALLILPGAWVAVVVLLALTVGSRVQVTPLLAAAPAIACAGTGRRQCVILGSACALFALVPIPGEPTGLGQRIGTALAIVVVAGASYLIAHRRQRLQRDYEHVHRIADVTQRVLLRPIPERLGVVATAVGYLSAAPGARVGGDFYDVLETPFGIRAVLGDARGSGLEALAVAAVLLGAFREAASYEAGLNTVALRLDAALTRHAAAKRATDDGLADLRAEDFATAVLVEISETGRDRPRDANDGATISVVSCGHPSPYLLGSGQRPVEPLETDCPAPPLGLYELDLSFASSDTAPHVRTVPFSAGTSVVLCTDGILDARDRDGAFFPIAEVLTAAAQHAGQASDVVSAIQDRLIVHTKGRLRDDAAVLVLSHIAAR
jgi:serine phosphatase RsbU (regulator of sigma subunit)